MSFSSAWNDKEKTKIDIDDLCDNLSQIFYHFCNVGNINESTPLNGLVIKYIENAINDYKQQYYPNDYPLHEIIKLDLKKFMCQMNKLSQKSSPWLTDIFNRFKYSDCSLNYGHWFKLLKTNLLVLSLYNPLNGINIEQDVTFMKAASNIDSSLLVEFVDKSIVPNINHCFNHSTDHNNNKIGDDGYDCRSISCKNRSLNHKYYVEFKQEQQEKKKNDDNDEDDDYPMTVQDGFWCTDCKPIKIQNRIDYKTLYSQTALSFIHQNSDRFALKKLIYCLWMIFGNNIVYNNKNGIEGGHFYYYGKDNITNSTATHVMKLLFNSNTTNTEKPPSLWSMQFLDELKKDPIILEYYNQLELSQRMDVVDCCFNEHYQNYDVAEIYSIYNYYTTNYPYTQNTNFIYSIDCKSPDFIDFHGEFAFSNRYFMQKGVPQMVNSRENLRTLIFHKGFRSAEFKYGIDVDGNLDQDSEMEVAMDQVIFEETYVTFEEKKYDDFQDREIRRNQRFQTAQQVYFEQQLKNMKDIYLKYDFFNNGYKKHHQVTLDYGHYIFTLIMTMDEWYPSRQSPIIKFDIKSMDVELNPMSKVHNLFDPQCKEAHIQTFFDQFFILWNQFTVNCHDFLYQTVILWKQLCLKQIHFIQNNITNSYSSFLMAISNSLFIKKIIPFLIKRDFSQKITKNDHHQKRFYVINDNDRALPLVCKMFYLSIKAANYYQYTLLGKNTLRMYYSSMPSVNNNANNNLNINSILIDQSDLCCFLTNIYSHVYKSQLNNNNNNNYNNYYYYNMNHNNNLTINMDMNKRAYFLIKKYGYYDPRQQKYLMCFIQFEAMYLEIFISEPQRIWNEFCILDAQINNTYEDNMVYQYGTNVCARLRSHWRTQLYLAIGHMERKKQRIWSVSMCNLKLQNGNYTSDGHFLCEECWMEYIGKLSCDYYQQIFEIILQKICQQPNLIHGNAVQLFRVLQWIMTNNFGNDQIWANLLN